MSSSLINNDQSNWKKQEKINGKKKSNDKLRWQASLGYVQLAIKDSRIYIF